MFKAPWLVLTFLFQRATRRVTSLSNLSAHVNVTREIRPVQKQSSGLSVDDVAFGVLTTGKFLKTRVKAQKETWFHLVRNLVIFSDTHSDGDLGLEVVVEKPEAERNEMLIHHTGARRALSVVEGLHKRFPHAKWYFIADDDTYVYVSNLLREVLGKYNSEDPHYIGWAYPATYMAGFFEGQYRPNVAIGGAGFVLSHSVVLQLLPNIPRCRRSYTWDWQGDFRIAMCVFDLGHMVKDDLHFYADSDDQVLLWGNGRIEGLLPPVSWHMHDDCTSAFPKMYMAQMVLSRDGVFRADFAPYAYFSGRFHNVFLNRTFHIVFGKRLSILLGNSTISNAIEMEAGQLLSFEEAQPGMIHSFQQHYQGGPCHESLGDFVDAEVKIHCGSCGGKPAPPTGFSVCRAHKHGPCNSELHLTLQCPVWEPIEPTTIDSEVSRNDL